MIKATLVSDYTTYCQGIGRSSGDTSNAVLMESEIDVALSACCYYTGWKHFVAFDEDTDSDTYCNCSGFNIVPSSGIVSLTTLTIDGNVIPTDQWKLRLVSEEGLHFNVQVCENFIQLCNTNVAKLTGKFGLIRTLTKYEQIQIFKLANGLAGKDIQFNIMAQNNNVAKMVSGSESVTYNPNAMNTDQIFILFSYFSDCRSILMKYRRFKMK